MDKYPVYKKWNALTIGPKVYRLNYLWQSHKTSDHLPESHATAACLGSQK